VKLIQHVVDPSECVLNLLFRAIMLTFAPHLPKAFRKELRFHPRFPEFNGKNVGSAVPVPVLNRAEQIPRDLHPEQVLDPGNARMLQKELADPADIGRGHLVNEIGSDGSSPLFSIQAWCHKHPLSLIIYRGSMTQKQMSNLECAGFNGP
jgi:hypothetical protein